MSRHDAANGWIYSTALASKRPAKGHRTAGRTTRDPPRHNARGQPGTTAQLIALNKPYGIVSQFSGGDDTLALLVPVRGVYPAGRLDKDSEGLLLLTDQGWLQHRIAHPRQKMNKTYWVQLDGIINDQALSQLRHGVLLKDGPARAVQAARMDEPKGLWRREPPIRKRKNQPTSWLKIVLAEGRNRQVRRMTAAAGFPTLRLIRYRIGPWTLDGIAPGDFRELRVSATDHQLD